MDVVYCAIAFAGFSGLFGSQFMKATMELLSFIFLLYLGLKYLLTPTLPATTPTVEAVEHKLHPHAAFWIGFVRVLGNPAVLLFWITVSATFISHDWINDTLASKSLCVLGTFVGGLLWFLLLSFLVAQGHGKFSTKALVRLAHVSGAILLAVSFAAHAFAQRSTVALPPGTTVTVNDGFRRPWQLVNQGVSRFDAEGVDVTAVAIEARDPRGTPSLLTPEIREYHGRGGQHLASNVSIRASTGRITQVMRVLLSPPDSLDVASVRVTFLPAPVLWPLGVVLLGLSATLALMSSPPSRSPAP